MTPPKWEPIVNVNEPQAARETLGYIRDIAAHANYLRVSLDAQMDEARELLALADQLILTAFRHFGGSELAQWRQRYAHFIAEVES